MVNIKGIKSKKKTITVVTASLLVVVAGFVLYMTVIKDTSKNKTETSKTCAAYEKSYEGRCVKKYADFSQRKASVLGDKLQKVLPATDYGGLWLNGENGRVTVGLVFASATHISSKQTIVSEAKTLGISDVVDVVPVKYPYAVLEQTTEAIHQLNEKNLKDSDWPIQVGPKTDLNKVQVDIPADSKNLSKGHRYVLSEIEKKYKNQVFFEAYDEPPRLD
jgi:hypothetical protein